MSEGLKWGILVVVGSVVLSMVIAQGALRLAKLEQEASIVETCIKHPATVSPFRGSY